MTSKVFSKPTDGEDVKARMNAQIALFERDVLAAKARGVDLHAERSARYKNRWKEALAFVNKGATVLDIGGGWMPDAIYDLLIKDFTLNYHAIDIETNYIKALIPKMAKAGLPKTNFSVGESSNIPYGNKFDLVFSSHCLEHATNIVETLEKIHNSIKDNGYLHFSVPLGFDLSDEHLLYFGPDEWVKLLSMTGYDVLSVTIGTTYTASGDLSICAQKKSTFPTDVSPAENLVSRFSKNDSVFMSHESAEFHYKPTPIKADGTSILSGSGGRCDFKISGTVKALIITVHSWSGCFQITDKKRKYVFDAYSPVNYMKAIDLTGFDSEFSIEILGKNPLSFAEECVIAGVLYN